MFYLPHNTYQYIPSVDLRYDALLRELAFRSKEVQKLREQAASFDKEKSAVAKRKLKRILEYIIWLRARERHA